MPVVDLEPCSDFTDWQPVARHLLTDGIPPEQVSWCTGPAQDLFAVDDEVRSPGYLPEQRRATPLKVSRRFVDLARFAASHSDSARFDLLYRLLWRISHGERELLANSVDPMVRRANQWAKEVGRDRHKMRAFVRFKEVSLRDVSTPANPEQTAFIAWFEPEHFILKLNAEFFCRRFHNMDWSIVSPYQSLHWQRQQLYVGAGADPSQVPQQDALEDYWRCYYAHIFNPARLKVQAMCREMPKKYWHNLPEAPLIPQLIKTADQRTRTMLAAPTHAQGKLPENTRFRREAWLAREDSGESDNR